MFAKLGRFSYRHRRTILAVWTLAFALGLVATLRLPPLLKGGGFTSPDTPSQRGQRVMQQRLGAGPASVTIVFTSGSLDARGDEFQARERRALAGIDRRAFPALLAVRTLASTGDASFVSRDGRASFAQLEFNATTEQVQQAVPALRRALRPAGLTTYVTGDPAVYAAIEQTSASDLRKAESYTFPIAVVVLLVIFGTLVAACVPVIGGAMAVAVTLGVFWGLAQVMDLSVFAMNVATLLGLAVGIDYALFMVGRFREELAAGRAVAEAVESTVRHAGRSIFFSGLTVFVGLLGLMSIPYMAMRSIALGGALVVVFSVLAALTLLPALLGVLGPRVDSLSILPARKSGVGGFWLRWSTWIMRHPVPVLLGTVALVVAFAWPVFSIVTAVPGANTLPRSAEARQGYDILQERFDAAALTPIEVIVTWDGGGDALAPGRRERLFAYGETLAALPGVARVTSVVNLTGIDTPAALGAYWQAVERGTADGASGTGGSAGRAAGGQAGLSMPGLFRGLLGAQQRRASLRLRAATTAPGTILYRVVPRRSPTDAAAQALARRILAEGGPAGTTVDVAGVSMTVGDFLHAIDTRFPWIILFVVCVTGLVLLVLLRSVVLPVKAVIMNVFSLLAGFGVAVWVFQQGHLEGLLGFKATGAIDAELPVLLFCTVFGVSMDYEVFLLTRMREAWEETGDNREAVRFGLARTGRIVTSAALIIVVVGGSFAFTSILTTKAIGVALAVAVAFDASVIRVLMVPAAMRLIGRWNWWLPGWLARAMPRLE